jgi:hypothetical protein
VAHSFLNERRVTAKESLWFLAKQLKGACTCQARPASIIPRLHQRENIIIFLHYLSKFLGKCTESVHTEKTQKTWSINVADHVAES